MKNKCEFEAEVYLKVSQHHMRSRKRAATFTAFSLVAVLVFSGTAVLLTKRMQGISDEAAGEAYQFSAEKADTANTAGESASRSDCAAETVFDDPAESESSGCPILSAEADYPFYDSAAEVAGAAASIYTGTVTDISFEIINMTTGETVSASDSSSASRMLYTVYTVRLTDSFKGDNPDEIKIFIYGGLSGYGESLQYSIAESAGLTEEYHGIPATADAGTSKLTVGAQYLFCTVRPAEGHDVPINPTQFAYDPTSASAAEIIARISGN